MQTVLSADGYATSSSAKSGKVCHWSMCEANMQPMLSAGKYAIGAKCGYIYVTNTKHTGKHATSAKCVETCNRQKARETMPLGTKRE